MPLFNINNNFTTSKHQIKWLQSSLLEVFADIGDFAEVLKQANSQSGQINALNELKNYLAKQHALFCSRFAYKLEQANPHTAKKISEWINSIFMEIEKLFNSISTKDADEMFSADDYLALIVDINIFSQFIKLPINLEQSKPEKLPANITADYSNFKILPDDIKIYILNFIANKYPEELANISRVSKKLNQLTQTSIISNSIADYFNNKTEQELDSLFKHYYETDNNYGIGLLLKHHDYLLPELIKLHLLNFIANKYPDELVNISPVSKKLNQPTKTSIITNGITDYFNNKTAQELYSLFKSYYKTGNYYGMGLFLKSCNDNIISKFFYDKTKIHNSYENFDNKDNIDKYHHYIEGFELNNPVLFMEEAIISGNIVLLKMILKKYKLPLLTIDIQHFLLSANTYSKYSAEVYRQIVEILLKQIQNLPKPDLGENYSKLYLHPIILPIVDALVNNKIEFAKILINYIIEEPALIYELFRQILNECRVIKTIASCCELTRYLLDNKLIDIHTLVQQEHEHAGTSWSISSHIALSYYEKINNNQLVQPLKTYATLALPPSVTPPLFNAIKTRHLTLVKGLVTHGANVNAIDMSDTSPSFKNTPLSWAIQMEVTESNYEARAVHVEILLKQGADLYYEDDQGDMPITKILSHYNNKYWMKSVTAVLDVLIKFNIDLNHQNQKGDTILHQAIQRNASLALILLLVDAGANFNISNKEGKNALNLLQEKLDKYWTEDSINLAAENILDKVIAECDLSTEEKNLFNPWLTQLITSHSTSNKEQLDLIFNYATIVKNLVVLVTLTRKAFAIVPDVHEQLSEGPAMASRINDAILAAIENSKAYILDPLQTEQAIKNTFISSGSPSLVDTLKDIRHFIPIAGYGKFFAAEQTADAYTLFFEYVSNNSCSNKVETPVANEDELSSAPKGRPK
jgi:hypothetical protein